MKRLDRTIQQLRFAQAARHIKQHASVLDIGASDGAWFEYLGDRLGHGVGIEPELSESVSNARWELRPGSFPGAVAIGEKFDVVTILAVLEHVRPEEQKAFAMAVADALVPEGLVVITVPAPLVDRMLDILIRLKIIDGMEADQHYGFVPASAVSIFEASGFDLVMHRRFELRLNHLFVFRRSA